MVRQHAVVAQCGARPRERGEPGRRRGGGRGQKDERASARAVRRSHASGTYTPCHRMTYAAAAPAGLRGREVVHRALVIDAVIAAMLRETMPDAEVRVYDMTGTMDHLEVFVRSKAFAGVSPLDRHRMVEKALAPARADGRIHALQIRTATPEDTNG